MIDVPPYEVVIARARVMRHEQPDMIDKLLPFGWGWRVNTPGLPKPLYGGAFTKKKATRAAMRAVAIDLRLRHNFHMPVSGALIIELMDEESS